MCRTLMGMELEESIMATMGVLLKTSPQNGEELVKILGQYLVYLTNTVEISYPRAGFLLDEATKIYGTKVDASLMLASKLFGELIDKRQPGGQEDAEGAIHDEVVSQRVRRKRRHRGDLAEDDFLPVDNMTGLCGKSMNESGENGKPCLSYMEKPITALTKNFKERIRVSVTLGKFEQKDVNKLRDWVLNANMMLVRETFRTSLRYHNFLDQSDDSLSDQSSVISEDGQLQSPGGNNSFETNNNEEYEVHHPSTNSVTEKLQEERVPLIAYDDKDYIYNVGESIAKGEDGSLDNFGCCTHNDSFTVKKDPLKPGPTIRHNHAYATARKSRKKNGSCMELVSLDSFFNPLIRPSLRDIPNGVLPDEELFEMYKAELKLLRLTGHRSASNADPRGVRPDTVDEFRGFDEDDDGNDDAILGDSVDMRNDIDLPLPNMSSVFTPDDADHISPNTSYKALSLSPEEIMEINKQRGMRIAAWHSSLAQKLKIAEARGPLDTDILAVTVMNKFSDEKPEMTFKELVQGQQPVDVSRIFLTCLQLTNEKNIQILKGGELEADNLTVVRLHKKRVREELDGYNHNGPSSSSQAQSSDEMTCSEESDDSDADECLSNLTKRRKVTKT